MQHQEKKKEAAADWLQQLFPGGIKSFNRCTSTCDNLKVEEAIDSVFEGNNIVCKKATRCTFKGNDCDVTGDHNIVTGERNRVQGNHNKVKGTGARVQGNDNDVEGNGCMAIGMRNPMRGDGCTQICMAIGTPAADHMTNTFLKVKPMAAAPKPTPPSGPVPPPIIISDIKESTGLQILQSTDFPANTPLRIEQRGSGMQINGLGGSGAFVPRVRSKPAASMLVLRKPRSKSPERTKADKS